VLLLLLAAILMPTAAVLWFMNRAVESERRVVRQTLTEAYRNHLSIVQERVESLWKEKLDALEKIPRDAPASSMFYECIRMKLADSAVCGDPSGRLTYPAPPLVPKADPAEQQSAWVRAGRLETSDRNFLEAARAYGAIAASAREDNVAARALQSQARCLARAGEKDAAINLVFDNFGRGKYGRATDAQGRLIAADLEMMALTLAGGPSDRRFVPLAERLRDRLLDYKNAGLPAAQRRFHMQGMQALPLPAEAKQFPTLEAEDLAARYVESRAPRFASEPALVPAGVPGVWQLPARNRRMLLLFREDTLLAAMRAFVEAQATPADVVVTLLSPGDADPKATVFHSLPAGRLLPGWRLTLALKDGGVLDATAKRQAASYFWTGILAIAAIALPAVLVAGVIRRQMRLTRLKNNLVATVSHELKTPLASMRLLVDTLLNDERFDPQKTREYLQLVARENSRLSRLIDNFLSFSRMERNKHAFDFREVPAAEVASRAAEAVEDRFRAPGCRFEVQVAQDLPPLDADPDALVTAVLNLLDNAFKYSGAEKHIILRAHSQDGQVRFEVQDNGIGLSRRDAKKVFKKFYQVDQRLSRTGGGVGLGLSIVEFIVRAHGGRVRVTSRPGEGSIFTLEIPAAPAAARARQEALT
jgi:signal transduction histidine kinase